MIISRGRGYIFVHIPKTGGTSMAFALEDRAMADDILIGDTPKARKRKRRLKDVETAGRLWKHSTLADIEGLMTREEIAQAFVFTLVRNPWDRVVSYYHWLRTQDFDHPAVGLAKTLPFAEFLRDPVIAGSFERYPFGRYLCDGAGVEHAGAVYVRLEHLVDDLAPVEAACGFDVALTRANESARSRDWRPFYTDADAEQVASFCAEDIARFGYVFDPEAA